MTDLKTILAAVVVWAVSSIGAFFYGQDVGQDRQVAKQTAIDDAIVATRNAALQGAADAIAKIKVTNTTIKGKTEVVVRENTVYRDCQHDPIGLLLVNEALTNGQYKPPGDSKLPTPDSPK